MAPASRYCTPEEYLELERNAEYKSEYIDGQIIPMNSRASAHNVRGWASSHNLVELNIGGELRERLKAGTCLVYPSSMRARVGQSRKYFYPDVAVVHDEPEFEDEHRDTLLNPIVLVEVVSPATANYDLGEKFGYCRELPAVQECLLVMLNEPRVQQFVRMASGWLFDEAYGQSGVISLRSIGCELPLSEVYRKVTFPPSRAGRIYPGGE